MAVRGFANTILWEVDMAVKGFREYHTPGS